VSGARGVPCGDASFCEGGELEFTHRKLSIEQGRSLKAISVSNVELYRLMPTPVYVYMQKNQKYVAIKSPLDFFSHQDIQKIIRLPQIYMTEFADLLGPIRNAAKAIRYAMDQSAYTIKDHSGKWKYPDVNLGVPSFVTSDSIWKKASQIWSSKMAVEPYTVAIFVDHLCSPIPAEEMEKAREGDIDGFELAILRSSWAVFLALQLGYFNPGYLNRLRAESFSRSVNHADIAFPRSEEEELIQYVFRILPEIQIHALAEENILKLKSRIAEKLRFRMERSKEKIKPEERLKLSIFGEKGFLSAG